MVRQRAIQITNDNLQVWLFKIETALDIKISSYLPFYPDINGYCDFFFQAITKENTGYSVNDMVYNMVKSWLEKELQITLFPHSEMNKIIPRKSRKQIVKKLIQDFEISRFDPLNNIIIIDILIIIALLAAIVAIFIFIFKNNVPLGMLSIATFIALVALANKLKTKFSTSTFKEFTDKFAREHYYEFNPDSNTLNYTEVKANIIAMLSEILHENITEETLFELYIPSND